MARVFVSEDPFADLSQHYWAVRGNWTAEWVDVLGRSRTEASVALYRLRFTVDAPATVRVHVSADNRYRLFLDGDALGRGPERGDPQHWRYESYQLDLAPGEHVFVAQSWWLGMGAPFAQMTVQPGFIVAAEGAWAERLNTGQAPWEGMVMPGFAFLPSGVAWGTGKKVRVLGDAYPWGWEAGANDGPWAPLQIIHNGMSAQYKNEIPPYWLLTPATLPPMLEEERKVGMARYVTGDTPYPVDLQHHLATEAGAWDTLLAGCGTVTVPAHTVRRVIIDLRNYYCAYPQLTVSGGAGATISLCWAEGLYEQPEGETKGNRNEIAGKYFLGVGDEFLPDGGDHRAFTTLWWEAGRYLELTVTTSEQPLTLDAFSLRETHYPLAMEGRFAASDPRLAEVIPIAVRALQMCSHETYMDCPYYEQLMYIGDTRLEVLVTYLLTRDDRLPRKALQCFDASRRLNGLTQSRYPCHTVQIIPPFALWFVGMIHDYWLWRDDPAFVRGLLPGARAVLEAFRGWLRPDGLLDAPNGPAGWNFTDWVPSWEIGIPPQGERAPSGVTNAHLALTLTYKAALEESAGETELAARDRATARTLMDAMLRSFWDEGRGMLADTLAKDAFSEHTQCLALLSGLLPADKAARVAQGLLTAPDLARTTIYFSHYLFETLYRLGQGETLQEHFRLWFDLAPTGFKTTFESPEPTRSDCHAWGAHPIYHYYASVLGVRPASPGFATVRIAPQLGDLTAAEGVLPHPAGEIAVALTRDGHHLAGTVTLPAGVTGTFAWNGRECVLAAGENQVKL
jgi:hypothetical protein